MENKQLYAIFAVVIILIAAVGAFVLFSGDDDEYKSAIQMEDWPSSETRTRMIISMMMTSKLSSR